MQKFQIWAMAILVLSCSGDAAEPATQFSSSPDARASEDSKSGGIYKGVIVGSSGTFAVVLQNGIKRIRLTMDGETRDLTTTALDSWVSGDPLMNILFEAGDWQAQFTAGSTGNVRSLIFTIPGHINPEVAILKELSTAQVRTFEGTYSGTSSGNWNFIVRGSDLYGVSRSADGGSSLAFFGLVSGTSISFQTINGSGSISGDTVSGTWSDPAHGGSGTWTGKRTM